jgi:hypothetical protein
MAHLQSILVGLEPVFLLLAVVAFFKSGSARRLPALATYFAIRGISALILEAEMWGWTPGGTPNLHYTIYFYSYWVSYIACAIALFFVIQEVFHRVMEPVPGLRRLGLIAFRWITIVSVVVAVGAIALPAALTTSSGDRIGSVAIQLMRCTSVLELCLLVFLALSVHALGRSFRSRLFGIGLGFGIQAATDLIFTAVANIYPGLVSAANESKEIIVAGVLLLWTVYFLVPEPATERKLIVLPQGSVMSRWNALANGIGQTPEIAVAEPTGFFLQDIEGVVDRVLAKNPVTAHR